MNAQQLVDQITTLPGYHTRGYGLWLSDKGVGGVGAFQGSRRFVVCISRGHHSVDVYARQLVEWLRVVGPGPLSIRFQKKDTCLQIVCGNFTAHFTQTPRPGISRIEV